MAHRAKFLIAVVLAPLICFSAACSGSGPAEPAKGRKNIVASDTILSGMIESLLPSVAFEVTAILPPGQCPGHYDMKLTDIAKVKKADLVLSFREMPFMARAAVTGGRHLLIETNGRNWMVPPSYINGLRILAEKLAERFPEWEQQIAIRSEEAIREVAENEKYLHEKIRRAGLRGRPVLASSHLKEPLEWMGFRVIGAYGTPEAMSAKEIIELIRIGRENNAAMIVDNLQSGPDAGKGIAEALGAPHVILANFPSEKGYGATLRENVDAALAAAGTL